jgi:thiol-disulfide isomerase/thioredoxin
MNPSRTTFVLGTLAIATLAGSAAASKRVVIAEEFTATWCTYCPSVAGALHQLQEDRPNDIIGMLIHCGDSYTTTWGNARQNFYNVGGYPTTWLDGWNSKVGSSGSVAANYSDLNNRLNSCLNQSTDVTIELLGEELSASQYRITGTVGIEAGGNAKTMRIQMLQCFDQVTYPEAGELQFNTLRQAATSFDISLSANGSHTFQHTFTLSGESLAATADCTYLCIVQAPNSSGPANVYNASRHEHGELPPEDVTVGPTGDYSTIQSAIDGVGSGSTITVMPGTYVGRLDFGGRSVNLVSQDGAETTIIDADQQGTAIRLMGGESATIDGFTVTGGSSALGSAMMINGSPQILNCIIRDNVATSNYCILSSGDPLISGTLFCQNSPNNVEVSWVDGGGNEFSDTCPNTEPCLGDISGDGVVDVNDLLAAVSGFGDIYDVNDILVILENFGNNC